MDELSAANASVLAIVYRDQLVAVCTAEDFDLTPRLAEAPIGDPEFAFVMLMITFARDVITGQIDGAYDDSRARRHVRDQLIPDSLLEDDSHWSDEEAAEIVGVPPHEIAAARIERRGALGT